MPTPFRILSLDGGGAKGFYTLGVLEEIEAMTDGKLLCQTFDLIYGTSTGSIIAALLARGESVATVKTLYEKHVPEIMRSHRKAKRTAELHKRAREVFGDDGHEVFKTAIGIVTTNWKDERPMIFKLLDAQAHGSKGSFKPFFGCKVADAVIASCSADPFFERHTVKTSKGDLIELADGGFCANNPTVYAIADATRALGHDPANVRIVNVGVGSYPEPGRLKWIKRILSDWGLIRYIPNSTYLQKVLGTNTCSMEVLRFILFEKTVPSIRVSEGFPEPEMATDLLEHDLTKLNRLVQKGRISFTKNEQKLNDLIFK